MSVNVKPVSRIRVSDQVFNQLKSLIYQKSLLPGQRIPGEHELSKQFSASRGSVREALHKLEAVGLVEIRNGSGAFVANWSLNGPELTENLSWLAERRDIVLDILQVRAALQGLGARLCAQLLSSEQLALFMDTLTDMTEADEVGNLEAVCEADMRFHHLIGSCSGNEVLHDLIVRMEDAYRISSRALMDLCGRSCTSLVEHNAIIQALVERNGELAEQHMLNHIASVRHDITNLSNAL